MKKLISVIMMMVSLAIVSATEKSVDLDKFMEQFIEDTKVAKAAMEELYERDKEFKSLMCEMKKKGDIYYVKVTTDNLEIAKHFCTNTDVKIDSYLVFPVSYVELNIAAMEELGPMAEELLKKADKFIDNPTMETYKDYLEYNEQAQSTLDYYNKKLENKEE